MQPFISYLSTNIVPVILMIAGFVCLVVEMYVPGFGVPGIAGIALTVMGIILGSNSLAQALIITLVVLVLLGVALFVCMRSAAKGRLSKSKLILHEVATDPKREDDLKYFEGREGVAHTSLRPAGIIILDDMKLNVVSEGEFIKPGERVKVVKVEGKKIVVDRI